MKSRITSPSAISVTLPAAAAAPAASPWPPKDTGTSRSPAAATISPKSRHLSSGAQPRDGETQSSMTTGVFFFANKSWNAAGEVASAETRATASVGSSLSVHARREEGRTEGRTVVFVSDTFSVSVREFRERVFFVVESSRRERFTLSFSARRIALPSQAGTFVGSGSSVTMASASSATRPSPSFESVVPEIVAAETRESRASTSFSFSETRSDPAILDPSASTCERCQHSCGQFPWSSWCACASVAALA
mmetsp:Transcript_6940/g.28472  ORF Transcript_6940/g.28472 Transcript_6940/m.28472 type:complete len:250 (+) Transcript_6940:631-1380(+)